MLSSRGPVPFEVVELDEDGNGEVRAASPAGSTEVIVIDDDGEAAPASCRSGLTRERPVKRQRLCGGSPAAAMSSGNSGAVAVAGPVVNLTASPRSARPAKVGDSRAIESFVDLVEEDGSPPSPGGARDLFSPGKRRREKCVIIEDSPPATRSRRASRLPSCMPSRLPAFVGGEAWHGGNSTDALESGVAVPPTAPSAGSLPVAPHTLHPACVRAWSRTRMESLSRPPSNFQGARLPPLGLERVGPHHAQAGRVVDDDDDDDDDDDVSEDVDAWILSTFGHDQGDDSMSARTGQDAEFFQATPTVARRVHSQSNVTRRSPRRLGQLLNPPLPSIYGNMEELPLHFSRSSRARVDVQTSRPVDGDLSPGGDQSRRRAESNDVTGQIARDEAYARALEAEEEQRAALEQLQSLRTRSERSISLRENVIRLQQLQQSLEHSRRGIDAGTALAGRSSIEDLVNRRLGTVGAPDSLPHRTLGATPPRAYAPPPPRAPGPLPPHAPGGPHVHSSPYGRSSGPGHAQLSGPTDADLLRQLMTADGLHHHYPHARAGVPRLSLGMRGRHAHWPNRFEMSYEAMLRLDESVDRNGRRAASRADIRKLPVSTATEADTSVSCCICMCDVEVGEELRTLPCVAKHKFHKACIDPWLKKNGCCPVDKIRVDGKPSD